TVYDNQQYYGMSSNLVTQFYPSTGVAVIKPNDIKSTTPGELDPKFGAYSVTSFNYGTVTIPIGAAGMPVSLTNVGTSDFRIVPASPGINKGKTDFSPLKTVTKTGLYGTIIDLPGKDIGAFQADGSGNQHYQ